MQIKVETKLILDSNEPQPLAIAEETASRLSLATTREVRIEEVRTAMVLAFLSAVQSANRISRQQGFLCLLHGLLEDCL
jgi:hypothetical protein